LEACFKVEVLQQDTTWVPRIVCTNCYKMLKSFEKTQDKSKLKFLKPAIWRKPLDKSDYCMTNVKGISKLHKEKILYATVSSVVRPQINSLECLVDKASRDSFLQGIDCMQVDGGPEEQCEYVDVQRDVAKESESVAKAESETDESEKELDSNSDEEYVPVGTEKRVKKISRAQLNDMFRNAGLAKDAAELMASQLKAHNVLVKDVNITFYRNREESFRKFLTNESDIVYCTDVKGGYSLIHPSEA